MRLSLRLIGILALAAVLPLVAAGLLLTSVSRRALEKQVRASQLAAATGIADATDQWLGQVLGRLELSGDLFDLAHMDAAARTGALRVVYRQLDSVDVVGLYDADGKAVVPPVYLAHPVRDDPHLPVSAAGLARFRARVPLDRARSLGLGVGRAYVSKRRHVVLLPVAVRVVVAGRPWALAVELTLRPLERLVARVPAGDVGTAYLVDREGRILAHPDGSRFLRRSAYPNLAAVLARGAGGVTRYGGRGHRLLAASAPLRQAPWVAVVERPEAQAFASVNAMGRRTLLIIALALAFALLVGLLLSRGISRPLALAADRARAIAGGDLDQRLPETGATEVRELAAAFNAMATELARSRTEIEGFNRQLQRRVAERTAELKQAQAELLQSRKLAAIGELGAGVAHELNNPLTGILGMAQLVLRKRPEGDPERKFLERIEADAKRCREVTMNLLRFSEQGDETLLADADANAVARSAVALQRSLLERRGVSVVLELAEDLPEVRADAAQLQQVLMNLLSNAAHASPEGGRVTVRSGSDGVFVHLVVSDNGRGIPEANLDRIFEPFFTTKEDWRGAGLGLSVAYQIVQAHHGTLQAQSVPGQGATFTVSLPIPSARTAAATAGEATR